MQKVIIGDSILYNGDCREILDDINDVDVCLTDPPYGLGKEYNTFLDTSEEVKKLADIWLPKARKISKRVVFTPGVTGQWFYPKPDWVMSWIVRATGSRGKWGFSNWQPILCYGKDAYLTSGKGARLDILDIGHIGDLENKFDHPCPKPLPVWNHLLNRVSLSGVVLDPFMGTGTTGVAAITLDRPFIGIEKDKSYFEICVERIKKAERQGSLFKKTKKPEQLKLIA